MTEGSWKATRVNGSLGRHCIANQRACIDRFLHRKSWQQQLGQRREPVCMRVRVCICVRAILSIHNVNPQRNANLGLGRRFSFGGRV